MSAVTDWLVEGPAWVAYRARLDLLGQPEQDADVQAARKKMLSEPAFLQLIHELNDWPGPVIKSHKTTLLVHKLGFLADVGFKRDDLCIQPLIDRILVHRSKDGHFTVPLNIPRAFGGDGLDHLTWMLCDEPMYLSALIRLGLGGDERVQTAAAHLASLVRDNGWPCAASPELGKFHGPGRKDDPCPFANLGMLKVMADLPRWRESETASRGIEMILNQWKNRRESRPYLFKMGTDFCKLKAPFMWYDLLHVMDTLSRFPQAHSDPRYMEMLQTLRSRADEQGRFSAESVYLAWGKWEFGQKKIPSYWITCLGWRCILRSLP